MCVKYMKEWKSAVEVGPLFLELISYPPDTRHKRRHTAAPHDTPHTSTHAPTHPTPTHPSTRQQPAPNHDMYNAASRIRWRVGAELSCKKQLTRIRTPPGRSVHRIRAHTSHTHAGQPATATVPQTHTNRLPKQRTRAQTHTHTHTPNTSTHALAPPPHTHNPRAILGNVL